ncbi:Uncharacterized protein QTN25_006380 [Entamoeba marina]
MSSIRNTPRVKDKKRKSTIEKSSRSRTRSFSFEKSSVDIPLKLDLNGVWVQALVSLNPDLVSGAVGYLLRQKLSEDERNKNAKKLFSFYNHIDKLPEFLNVCIEREYFMKVNEPTKYTAFTSLTTPLVADADSELFAGMQTMLVKRYSKVKSFTLDDEEKSGSEKVMNKLKELLVTFVDLWIETPSPPILDYFWSASFKFYQSKGLSDELLTQALLERVYVAPFNCFISLWTAHDSSGLESIILFSKLFRAILSPSQTTYWKKWIYNNCRDLHDRMIKYAMTKAKLEIDRDDVHLTENAQEAMEVIEILNTEWESVVPFISNDGHLLLQQTFGETPVKKQAMKIIRDISNLRVNSFNETQSYLLNLTAMKQKIKDLQEERRYLKSMLEGDSESATSGSVSATPSQTISRVNSLASWYNEGAPSRNTGTMELAKSEIPSTIL